MMYIYVIYNEGEIVLSNIFFARSSYQKNVKSYYLLVVEDLESVCRNNRELKLQNWIELITN